MSGQDTGVTAVSLETGFLVGIDCSEALKQQLRE
jgi:hypothetical protein